MTCTYEVDLSNLGLDRGQNIVTYRFKQRLEHASESQLKIVLPQNSYVSDRGRCYSGVLDEVLLPISDSLQLVTDPLQFVEDSLLIVAECLLIVTDPLQVIT